MLMTKNILITRKISNIAVFMLAEKGYVVDVSQKDKILTQQEIINLLNKKSYDAVITLLTDNINKIKRVNIITLNLNTKV